MKESLINENNKHLDNGNDDKTPPLDNVNIRNNLNYSVFFLLIHK